MQVDLEELERLAKAAISHRAKGCTPEFCEAMDSFRATSNPEAMLALIARVRELEAECKGQVLVVREQLRADGWMVAVHNDYRQDGALRTFWLLTKGDRCVKGEGDSDQEALEQIAAKIKEAEGE